MRIFEKIAKFNGYELNVVGTALQVKSNGEQPSGYITDDEDQESDHDEADALLPTPSRKEEKKVPSLLHYLQQKEILVNLVLMTVIITISTFNYFMINFTVKYLPGDFHLNSIYLFASDIPACILVFFMLEHFRAKTVFLALFMIKLVAGICILAFIEEGDPGLAFPFLIACARGGAYGI